MDMKSCMLFSYMQNTHLACVELNHLKGMFISSWRGLFHREI